MNSHTHTHTHTDTRATHTGGAHRFAVRGGGKAGLDGAGAAEVCADVGGLAGDGGAAGGGEAAVGGAQLTRGHTQQGAQARDVLRQGRPGAHTHTHTHTQQSLASSRYLHGQEWRENPDR